MGKKKTKQTFKVGRDETVDDCLNRMKSEGFVPVRRMEEPVWEEVDSEGGKQTEIAYQQIIFEGKPKSD
ncbi:NETI motif-containing protein [Salisediminibacterium halotolerans]|uniref:NETI motif-containing protein n=1 Tax=Salisediminibacterium halotolerans TaxID=517425 RepID=UPI000EB483D3|nr:NETI motif-containing protein [Salisediminibacterium halotolerans]RLJ71757.1 NETI protein [Actinophytocola xinjiangensis]RPE86907.1 NETI protein [Salisediminibacterium halotolerans]TWG32970.1 NETI protein [Salisediminibacterium halotolerans]GEL08576.1 NETI motif-containing protein [Salisediminibacterium halotolerans]